MTYKEIRDQFVEISGRYDLITATGEDNGADFFLNAAQRWLDKQQDSQKAEARSVQSVDANTIKVYSPGLRVVREVWYTSADDTVKTQLSRESLSAIKDYYEQGLSSVTGDVPTYYAPVSFRPYPDTQTSLGWSGYKDIEDLILDDIHYLNNGVVIMPKPTTACYISIVGLFYSPALSATLSAGVWTQTQSWWTLNNPDTLIATAMMKLHSLYMNTSGAADMKAIVQSDLKAMDDDDADNDSTGVTQMRG